MSTRERFEQSWKLRCKNNYVASPLPHFTWWNSSGEPESDEVVKKELKDCQERIIDLKQRLDDEVFTKKFCEKWLAEFESRKSVVLRSASALKTASIDFGKLKRSSRSEVCADTVQATYRKIESIYSVPADNCSKSEESENLYCEPFISPEEDLYATPLKGKMSFRGNLDKKLKCPEEPAYEDIEEVRSAVQLEDNNGNLKQICIREPSYNDNEDAMTKDNQDDDSSDDDSVADLLAIRQTLNRVSQFCIDGGSTRQQLEMQAQRLSTRFSCMFDVSKQAVNDSATSTETTNLTAAQESLLCDESRFLSTSTPPMVTELDSSVPTPSVLGSFNNHLPSTLPDLLSSTSGPFDMRKYLVVNLLESEQSYLQTLESLLQWWNACRTELQVPELESVFTLLSQLRNAHGDFCADLRPVVNEWNSDSSIGSALKVLASYEYSIAPEYLRNYQRAITAISKYQLDKPSSVEVFKSIKSDDKSSFEDLLRKPVIRFERNTLVLHDLIKYTPTGHADYDLLQKTLRLARHFLDNLVVPDNERDNPENQRYLVKHGLIVEKLGKERKLRHIFLFNDVIAAAKQRVAGRQKDQYDIKWFIPLAELSIDDKVMSNDDDHKLQLENLQRKVIELQTEFKQEVRKGKDMGDGMKARILRRNKTVEKIRKKLMEQEVALVIAMPHMCFRINHYRQHKQYVLMMSSDYERSEWRDTITGLLQKAFQSSLPSLSDVQSMLGKNKAVLLRRTGTSLDRDTLFIEEERLFGCLHVLISQLHGLKQPVRTFCRIEVDSFGHFLTKAKTTVKGPCQEPTWGENFEVDLDGAQTLRVLCYSHDKGVEVLLGKGALELSNVWVKDEYLEHAIAMNNELTLQVSLKYLSHEETAERLMQQSEAVLFGARLDAVTKREGCNIPSILIDSVEEVESRGLDEEGLYRISGLTTEVESLKDAFEKSQPSVIHQKLKNADIHAVTSLIKLFFRSSSDPLFTDRLYSNFAEGIGLADPDAKDRHMIATFCSLPSPNFSTAVYLMDHLIRVSRHEQRNKMNLKNLATVFGPTVLRPPNRNSHHKTTDQLFFLAANDVVVQTTVLYHLLVMRASGTEFERTSF